MKKIAFILSIYMLIMAVLPCADNASFSVNSANDIAQFSSLNLDHSHDCEDDCTPFCVCQCCGNSIIVTSLLQTRRALKIPNFAFSFNYSFNYTINYSLGIWHPPTIG